VNIAIETTDLSKHFIQKPFLGNKKTVRAVQNINLQVREGELFGLVGPNQAGKTTLIKLLCTLILPTSGNAIVRGYDTSSQQDQVKSSIGLVAGEDRSFYWRLTGRQNLHFFTSLYGLSFYDAKKRINEILDFLEIGEMADVPFQSYSSGIKQRMHIARSLLNDPQVLFLDEAMKSLDPHTAHKLKPCC
jgi:ABC-2 type transport system ATP-binding protein